VIDPGHGGKDPGAIGRSLKQPTYEKDITLAVALELKKIIDQKKEIKGVLTRDSDVFIPLHRRASIAQAARGKLFISIHANASLNPSVSGMEVFFLSQAKTEDAKEVARLENEALKYEENLDSYSRFFDDKDLSKEMMDIHLDMFSNIYLWESQDMSRILIDTIAPMMDQENRGVKQAGFYVMLGTQAYMPSVLFEIGFISNPKEEVMLRRSTYQRKLAQGIYDSIIAFKKRHEGGLFRGANN
jgi:N-acetylmuramoyl-L-alanine amidase